MDDIITELKESSRDIDLHALRVLVMSSNYIFNLKHSTSSDEIASIFESVQTRYLPSSGKKCLRKAGSISTIPRNAHGNGLANGILHLLILSPRVTLWDSWELRIRHLV